MAPEPGLWDFVLWLITGFEGKICCTQYYYQNIVVKESEPSREGAGKGVLYPCPTSHKGPIKDEKIYHTFFFYLKLSLMIII